MNKLMGARVLNLPNIITTFRLLLIPLYVINLTKLNKDFALVILTIFILTDMLDGISARITRQITKFGRVYDGVTDFLLMVLSCIAFYAVGFIKTYWLIIFIIPSLVVSITKITQYVKLKDYAQSTFARIVGGISYVAIISVIINFAYTFHILVLTAVLAYIYAIVDILKILRKI